MKAITLLSSIALLCPSAASAQTTPAQRPTTSSSRNAAQTVTLIGCVGSIAGPQGGFMLSNPLVVPPSGATATAQAGTPASTQPSAAQPNAGSPIGTPGTASTGVGTAGTAATGVGTAGTATGVGTEGTAGVGSNPASATGTPSNAVGAGTAGSVATATPGAAGSVATGAGTTTAMNGYRLSGADMASWSGQRVQIVGTVVPGQTRAAAAPTNATNAGVAAPMPELRVQSVQPVDGPCPK
jgi:hypothetical protein